MPEKRPHPDDDDSLRNGSKRPRSNNASPAPTSNGAAAKPDIQKQIAEARARAEAVKARLAAAATGGSASPAPASPAAAQSPAEAARAKIEAMKARVAAATAKAGGAAQQRPTPPAPSYQPPEYEDTFGRARGGLGIGLHPALMGDTGQDKSKGKQAPKFATTLANRRAESPAQKTRKQLDLSGPNIEELKKNPYFDVSIAAPITGRARHSRQLVFNQKGKYIAQAAALRRQKLLENMKRRIQLQARKAGLEDEGEKAYLIQDVPDVEWWDEGLLTEKSYDSKPKIDTEDSIVTIYVQHPVLMEPPQEKFIVSKAPTLYLTKKEQAKLRRQRRMADHKEQQAKIRLGLEPPPPPKVKLSNLMRVLGDSAVKDPTAVEAQVRRQVQERREAHEEANEERKLTKEQRHEKLAKNQEADATHGIYVAVYRIDNLSYGKHRYQIDINAKQSALTGVAIVNPKFCLVVVEGGAHSITFYRKLMLNRIKWTENAMPSSVREGNREAEAAWLSSVDESTGALKDLSFNTCTEVWTGQNRERRFRKWLGVKVCETDSEARDLLSRAKMENFWTLAKTTTGTT